MMRERPEPTSSSRQSGRITVCQNTANQLLACAGRLMRTPEDALQLLKDALQDMQRLKAQVEEGHSCANAALVAKQQLADATAR